ncbi:MAG: hypothetical protein CMF63_08265 [Magnetovibrio sp.]|nr:hypothetical protein [Magnetovibrio sp.]
MPTVTYRKTPLKVLRRMQPKTARAIRDKVAEITEAPSGQAHGVVKLAGRPGYRVCVGDWRVIFEMDGEALDVLDINTRGGAYKTRKRKRP